jgi:cyclophilin family peptidyl-prolyl cis-trans isomerase
MPKTTKRDTTRRAEKIAKAHATPPPPIQVKQPKQPRSAPGYKRPARGLARYPWAIFLSLLVIGGTLITLYFYHLGPFAPPKPVVIRPTPTPNLTLPNPSPCAASSIVSELTDKSAAPTAAEIAKIQHTYSKAPAMTIDVHKFYCVGINTNRGLIVLELDPQYAPVTVNNFVYLAEHQFYDGLVFHRVVPGFVIQAGDPKGTGQGGPGYAFKDEPVRGKYAQGCVAMANSGPNTNGSQFFICTADDTTKLQNSYNLFGRVVSGMDVALKIQGPGDASSTKNIKPDVMNYVTVVPVA